MRNILLYIMVAATLCAGWLQADDESIRTGFRFLTVNPSARSVAMGNTSCALEPDGNAVYNNPAAISKLNKITLAVSSVEYFADQSFFNGALIAEHKAQNYGILFQQYAMPDFMEYYKFQEKGQLFKNKNMAIGFSVCTEFNKKASLGASLKYMRNSFYTYENRLLTADIGTIINNKSKDACPWC